MSPQPLQSPLHFYHYHSPIQTQTLPDSVYIILEVEAFNATLSFCTPHMALLHKLAPFTSLHTPSTKTSHSPPPRRRVISFSASPFTEKHSLERYQRDQWVYESTIQEGQSQTTPFPLPCDSASLREHDIALQLPELKKLLQVLREKRECGEEGCVPGNVFLVGTGPGDPELLTLKAMRVIKSADLLLYDRLVSNDVLDLVGPDARLLYVGKTAGYHSRTQEEIHELLLSFAEAGATVVRLKARE